jgi:hypothetical protein
VANAALHDPTGSSDYFGLAVWELTTPYQGDTADYWLNVDDYDEEDPGTSPYSFVSTFELNRVVRYKFHRASVPDDVLEGDTFYINMRFRGSEQTGVPRIRMQVFTDHPGDLERAVTGSKRLSFDTSNQIVEGGVSIPFTDPKPTPDELKKLSIITVSEWGAAGSHDSPYIP